MVPENYDFLVIVGVDFLAALAINLILDVMSVNFSL